MRSIIQQSIVLPVPAAELYAMYLDPARHAEDSTLILTFTPMGAEGRIDLVHLDVPGQDHQGVADGWEAYY